MDAIREAVAAAAGRAADSSAKEIAFALPPAPRSGDWPIADRSRAVAEGVLLGTYRMRKYLTGEERSAGAGLREARLIVPRSEEAEARRGTRVGGALCAAANLARDLVNEPAIALTPVRMAEYAEALAARAGLECRVYDEKGLDELGMGAFLGVARGSHQPPRFIHLTYRPEGAPVRKVALVGKGLTFDSGGLSLKSATGMETMKLDKAGAAAVLATMVGLKDLRPKVEVHGLMGMTENMPGGSAIKPGDILTTAGGKTVEVLNTDAEGRLVLADLLCFTRRLGVDETIDLATLTGACVVALGPLSTGVFGSDRALVDRLLAAAEKAGEKMWPLPLYSEYRDQLRSELADVKNTGDRYGGAITAALFLREFVATGSAWAHLDIAGPAFIESRGHPYMRKGASGAGVRTLLTYLSSLSESH
jgi:leucyl aminopeptidase